MSVRIAIDHDEMYAEGSSSFEVWAARQFCELIRVTRPIPARIEPKSLPMQPVYRNRRVQLCATCGKVFVCVKNHWANLRRSGVNHGGKVVEETNVVSPNETPSGT